MNILSHLITIDKIPHALLLTGNRNTPLDHFVKQFAVELLGKYPHPDIREYFPEGKVWMHPISNIRELCKEVAFVPYQAQWKLFIVHEAERMLAASSHALLKTCEEPSVQTIIVLLSRYPEKLLPTILSRCRTITLPASSKRVEHEILYVLAGEKSIGDLKEEQQIDSLLETILLWYRDRMLLSMQKCESYLTYPEYQEKIKKTPLLPLHRVEKALKEMHLGYERSIKLSICWEAFILTLASGQ